MSDFLILRLDKAEDWSLFLKQVATYIDQGYQITAGAYEFERNRAWVMIVKHTPVGLPNGQIRINEQFAQG